MVVEEPSIVAALSAAARLARRTGGFVTERTESLLIGQVHLTDLPDPDAAAQRLEARRDDLLAAGNAVHPRLVARGGGLRDLTLRRVTLDDGQTALVVHLLVDTRDAMGANLVNTLCEALAPEIAALSGGHVALRILSNLADLSVITARVRFALGDLGADAAAASRARDGIVLANRIARADPYRAATHNKGIMNGVDALAIATGNDWRALEAGVHAWAARDGRYTALTDWCTAADGDLEGSIRIPLKPGIVGGSMANNPAVGLCLRLCGARSAGELAALMAAVGLAQNFAALRALVTTGIQAGHMRLHARSVAAATRAAKPVMPAEIPVDERAGAVACGKVILFGEHAVVYGRHALALPVWNGVRAFAAKAGSPRIDIPEWGVSEMLAGDSTSELGALVDVLAAGLGLERDRFAIAVRTRLPRAMGLGSSAALAVAVGRALALAADIAVDDQRINELAFECEKLAHGTPSGIDNTVACYGEPLLYRRGQPPQALELGDEVPLVIACSSEPGRTAAEVTALRDRRARNPAVYERLFDEMDALALDGRQALVSRDYESLGLLMNIAHGLLNALGVSTAELETLVTIAREAGAMGAKLTGSGGGGSIVALCPGRETEVTAAFAAAGYRTVSLGVGSG
jgi:hydroxymethylglutaryl-CoA reductase